MSGRDRPTESSNRAGAAHADGGGGTRDSDSITNVDGTGTGKKFVLSSKGVDSALCYVMMYVTLLGACCVVAYLVTETRPVPDPRYAVAPEVEESVDVRVLGVRVVAIGDGDVPRASDAPDATNATAAADAPDMSDASDVSDAPGGRAGGNASRPVEAQSDDPGRRSPMYPHGAVDANDPRIAHGNVPSCTRVRQVAQRFSEQDVAWSAQMDYFRSQSNWTLHAPIADSVPGRAIRGTILAMLECHNDDNPTCDEWASELECGTRVRKRIYPPSCGMRRCETADASWSCECQRVYAEWIAAHLDLSTRRVAAGEWADGYARPYAEYDALSNRYPRPPSGGAPPAVTHAGAADGLPDAPACSWPAVGAQPGGSCECSDASDTRVDCHRVCVGRTRLATMWAALVVQHGTVRASSFVLRRLPASERVWAQPSGSVADPLVGLRDPTHVASVVPDTHTVRVVERLACEWGRAPCVDRPPRGLVYDTWTLDHALPPAPHADATVPGRKPDANARAWFMLAAFIGALVSSAIMWMGVAAWVYMSMAATSPPSAPPATEMAIVAAAARTAPSAPSATAPATAVKPAAAMATAAAPTTHLVAAAAERSDAASTCIYPRLPACVLLGAATPAAAQTPASASKALYRSAQHLLAPLLPPPSAPEATVAAACVVDVPIE